MMDSWPKIQLAYLIDDMQPGFAQRPDTARANTPQLRTNNVSREGNIDLSELKSVYATEDELEKYGVRRGDVIFNNTNSPELLGKTAYFDLDEVFVVSNHMTRIRVSKELLDGEYLAKYLHYLWLTGASVRFAKRWVNQAAIDQDGLAKFEIVVPPLPEQRRIVAILRQADELRRERREIDEQAKQLLPALFQEMFGDPITNPKHWKIGPFAELGQTRLGKMLDKKKQRGGNRRLYLRNVNVQWGRFDLSEVFEMEFREDELIELRLVKGDVLICEGGEVGRAAIWNDEFPECYFQKALHRVRPYDGIATSEYIESLMWALAKRGGFRDLTSQATIAHLTGEKLATLRVPFPPYDLQQMFSEQVRSVRAFEKDLVGIGRQFSDLINSTLQQAFTGELTASWREKHLEELQQAAEERDRLLAERGRVVVSPSLKPEVVEVAAGPDVKHPRYALLRELSPAQYQVYQAAQQETGYFTAETLASNRNLDAEIARETLPVLEAVGLIARVNLISDESLETDPKQPTRQFRKIAYAPIYRAPRPEDDSRRDDLEALELAYPEFRQVRSDLEAGKSLSL